MRSDSSPTPVISNHLVVIFHGNPYITFIVYKSVATVMPLHHLCVGVSAAFGDSENPILKSNILLICHIYLELLPIFM